MERRKPGRPSKGPRAVLAGKVPIPIKDTAQRRAHELGMNINDYLAALVTRDAGASVSTDPEVGALDRTA